MPDVALRAHGTQIVNALGVALAAFRAVERFKKSVVREPLKKHGVRLGQRPAAPVPVRRLRALLPPPHVALAAPAAGAWPVVAAHASEAVGVPLHGLETARCDIRADVPIVRAAVCHALVFGAAPARSASALCAATTFRLAAPRLCARPGVPLLGPPGCAAAERAAARRARASVRRFVGCGRTDSGASRGGAAHGPGVQEAAAAVGGGGLLDGAQRVPLAGDRGGRWRVAGAGAGPHARGQRRQAAADGCLRSSAAARSRRLARCRGMCSWRRCVCQCRSRRPSSPVRGERRKGDHGGRRRPLERRPAHGRGHVRAPSPRPQAARAVRVVSRGPGRRRHVRARRGVPNGRRRRRRRPLSPCPTRSARRAFG